MSHDARAISNFILDLADKHGYAITNMALNKVIYFSHGWYLALNGKPLVATPFEAWEHGPVLPVVYHQFKRHKDGPIQSRATFVDLETGEDRPVSYSIGKEDRDHLVRMIRFYAPKSGPLLSYMSHEPGAPWDQVRSGANRPGMVISDTAIQEFFASKLRSRTQGLNGQA